MNWWKLRSVGNLRILKVSYLTLAVVPTISKYETIAEWLGIGIPLLALLFFASLFLALANLLYDILCPVIVKRFASPNDMYRTMLEIKDLSQRLYPKDNFQADLEHCKSAYTRKAEAIRPARVACSVFYFGSGIMFSLLLLNRSWAVFLATIRALCET